jgi:hypothetical protein
VRDTAENLQSQAEVALQFIGAGTVGIIYYGGLFKRVPQRIR